MRDEQDLIPDIVKRAVECVLRDEYNAARSALGSIDYERLASDRKAALRARRVRLARAKVLDDAALPAGASHNPARQRRRRTEPPAAMRLATFERDHFICRYLHCQKRTIHLPVLRALSALFPDIIPYSNNWTPLGDLILYWTYSTSIEHRVSFPHGGTSDPENLITACYGCNDIKNMIRAGDLGWEVATIREEDWDGLNRYLPGLEEALAGQSKARRRCDPKLPSSTPRTEF
jgi:5-methylcytosine-specific restriction endonuclease McrA